MVELERSAADRRLYSLHGVGTLRLAFASRTATAEADGRRWRIARRGLGRLTPTR